jgi:hypothetical protein
VLSKIGEVEGIAVPEADVEAEIGRGRQRYAGDRKLIAYFESDRGRNFIRSTLRRTLVVERLVDDWLAAHPEHAALPHVEDAGQSASESAALAAAASTESLEAHEAESSQPTGAEDLEPAPRATEPTATEPTATGAAG